MPEIEVQALLALAMGRREELHGKLRRGSSVAFSEGSEVLKLQKLLVEQQEEIGRLENIGDWVGCKSSTGKLNRLGSRNYRFNILFQGWKAELFLRVVRI